MAHAFSYLVGHAVAGELGVAPDLGVAGLADMGGDVKVVELVVKVILRLARIVQQRVRSTAHRRKVSVPFSIWKPAKYQNKMRLLFQIYEAR
jgi:hypothetical protein